MKQIEIVESFVHERLMSGGCGRLSAKTLNFTGEKMNFTGTHPTVVTAGKCITEGE